MWYFDMASHALHIAMPEMGAGLILDFFVFFGLFFVFWVSHVFSFFFLVFSLHFARFSCEF